MQFPKTGWINSHSTGKVWENFTWSRSRCNPETWDEWIPILRNKNWKTQTITTARECTNSNNMEIFLWKSISFPDYVFFFLKKYGNIYFQFMENRWVHVFPTNGSVEIFLMEKINFLYFMCNRGTTRKFSGQVRFAGIGALR